MDVDGDRSQWLEMKAPLLEMDSLFALTPSGLLDSLESHFPLVAEMKATPQDAEWHAEGDVRCHTEWVIAEMQGLLENELADEHLSPSDRAALLLGAALHNIGKPLTTRPREIDGRERIVSPGHAGRGRSYVALRLIGLGLPAAVQEVVLALIGHHHDPMKLVRREAPDAAYRRLARVIDPALIYWLELADGRGRECGDSRDGEEWLELYRLRCEELGLWRGVDPYAGWREELSVGLSGNKCCRDYVLKETIMQHEEKAIQSPAEALARTYPYRESHSRVTITCGLSGSGKSHWLSAQERGEIISLDDLREELCGKREDQSKNGQVLQLAKERFKACLRDRRDVVWDGTNIREDGRSMIVQLARDYHAHTRLVVFAAPLDQVRRRNRKRKDAIPVKALEAQIDRFEWPEIWEAHDVVVEAD